MSKTLHIFTSAAVNYLPKVRILCHSIRQFHPEAIIHFVLSDKKPEWLDISQEPFDSVLAIDQLDIPNWLPWSFTHNIVELSTAIKPFALLHLLQRSDCEKVLYFDPDMVLFSRVDDILLALDDANITLTPHVNKPEKTLDAILDNEVASLKHGIFNLGFLGIHHTSEGMRFAYWWADRIYQLCRADVPNGLFTDQKWVDFAPVFFEKVHILKSSRHNVATWNLTTRYLSGDFAQGFQADGEPLGFYHFTGFDSGAHRIMAAKNAIENPAVETLVSWYEEKIKVANHDPISQWPWAFGQFSDGSKIETWHRHVYRDHPDLQAAYPNPYQVHSAGLSFLGWCNTEGKIHYPQYFSNNTLKKNLTPILPNTSFRHMSWWQLIRLIFSPRRGIALRQRLWTFIKTKK